MGNSDSVDQDITISCDRDFIATRLYGKQYDELKAMQRSKVDSYQETMEANKKMYSGVLELTEQQRERLYRLAEVTYKMDDSHESERFNLLFELGERVSAVKEKLSNLKELPYGRLMKERQRKMRQRDVKIQALEKELETLKSQQKKAEGELSKKNKKLYKEYQEMDVIHFWLEQCSCIVASFTKLGRPFNNSTIKKITYSIHIKFLEFISFILYQKNMNIFAQR